ncbi:MAG: hypothetical protein LQ351_000262 [Letrouitia transgressa]|nr:MAG: hypothetical protein LQ351_000262 [Letrouitia transgressa]
MPSTTKNTRPEPSMSTETHFPAENPVPSATEDTDLEPSMSTSTLADQASTSLVCNSGLGEIRCGSICCKEFQFCAYFGQCSDIGGASESSTSLAVPEYTIPTIVGTSQDSIQTTSILASISPYPRQGSPSYSVAITPSAPANTTSVAVSANSTMPTSRATSSSSVTHTVGFKAGVIVGAVVFFIIAIIVAIYGWRRYKKDAFKTKIEEDTSNIEPPPAHPFTMTNPPSPNPYRQPFPLVPSFTDERSSANNRSRYNDNLVPDQDQEQYRSQPNIRYAPPLNPYAAFQRNHDQERHNS